MAHEKELKGVSGWLMIVVIILVAAAAGWSLANKDAGWAKVASVVVVTLDLASCGACRGQSE